LAEAIAQADLDRDALCGAEFVIGHGATPYRNGRVLHSVFAAARLIRPVTRPIINNLDVRRWIVSLTPTLKQ
ncbi:hypothetical protein JTM05_25795, partial [Pseudomonas aeruginosa]|nr:hypothetical protein [Pseudomonas aeruginosa]